MLAAVRHRVCGRVRHAAARALRARARGGGRLSRPSMTAALEPQARSGTAARGRRALRLRAVLLLCAVVSCRRSGGRAVDVSDAATTEPSSSPPALAALLPARCRATPVGFSLDDARPGRDELEVGDALAYPQGYAIGFIHRTSAGRVAAVALLHLDAVRVRVVDLGPTLGDAPPPHVVWRSNELVAAELALHGAGAHTGDDSRELSLLPRRVRAGPETVPVAPPSVGRLTRVRFGLRRRGRTRRMGRGDRARRGQRPGEGVIRAATVRGDQRGPVKDVSPPESDAEAPRVVSLGYRLHRHVVSEKSRAGRPLGGRLRFGGHGRAPRVRLARSHCGRPARKSDRPASAPHFDRGSRLGLRCPGSVRGTKAAGPRRGERRRRGRGRLGWRASSRAPWRRWGRGIGSVPVRRIGTRRADLHRRHRSLAQLGRPARAAPPPSARFGGRAARLPERRGRVRRIAAARDALGRRSERSRRGRRGGRSWSRRGEDARGDTERPGCGVAHLRVRPLERALVCPGRASVPPSFGLGSCPWRRLPQYGPIAQSVRAPGS